MSSVHRCLCEDTPPAATDRRLAEYLQIETEGRGLRRLLNTGIEDVFD